MYVHVHTVCTYMYIHTYTCTCTKPEYNPAHIRMYVVTIHHVCHMHTYVLLVYTACVYVADVVAT